MLSFGPLVNHEGKFSQNYNQVQIRNSNLQLPTIVWQCEPFCALNIGLSVQYDKS